MSSFYPSNPSSHTLIPYDLPGHIYRGQKPDAYQLAGWEKQLNELKITTIVLLITQAELFLNPNLDLKQWYEQHKFNVIHFPIKDFSFPQEKPLTELLDRILLLANEGNNVMIHCKAGIGRTGIVCACLAKRVFETNGDVAVAWLRRYIRGAVETKPQLDFVRKFGQKTEDREEVQVERTQSEASKKESRVVIYQVPVIEKLVIEKPRVNLENPPEDVEHSVKDLELEDDVAKSCFGCIIS